MLLGNFARASLAGAERLVRADRSAVTIGRVKARVVVPCVYLVGLRDHVIEKAILLINFEEAQIRYLLNTLEVQITFNHSRLGHEELEDYEEANDRVTIELEALIVILTTSARRS